LDNITHSLAGMLAAEAVCTFRRETRQELRAAAYLLSGLANNLPDIDVVYSSWLTGPKPLGSLLHHRGHTHTLLFAALGAWLLYWVALRLFARKNQAFSQGERRLLLGLCLAGPLLHLSMDLGNNYGVHPFWPVSGRWYYGDTIFIVEPLWWALTVPILAHRLARRWLKLVLWILLGTLLVVCWFVPLVVPASRYALLLVTALGVALTRSGSARACLAFAAGGCLLVALLFGLGSLRAKAALRGATEAAFPALEVYDIAATPMPGNPACWEGLVAGEQGGSYRVLRAKVSLPPLALASCAAGVDTDPTAPVRPLDRPMRSGVEWQSEYRADLGELRALRKRDCRFRALLKFTRLPYAFYTRATGSFPRLLKAGDLRYDRVRDLDFSDVELPQAGQDACPRFVPGWAEPRADLLAP
jgi:inner membrane protein